MAMINPLWVDVTWRAGSSSNLTLEICQHVQMFSGLDVMMHLTCTHMKIEDIDEALEKCKEYGVRNILALRGDTIDNEDELQDCQFKYAIDLINYIKEKYGDYFCIGTAGYPETHLEASSADDDMKHLKAKIDAGAEIIITQMFFDNQVFLDFEKKCREVGIDIPVIPGILPIQNYGGFKKMTELCKTKVPEEVTSEIESIKNDEAQVKKFGVDL